MSRCLIGCTLVWLAAGLSACGPRAIDPAPPLHDEHHTEADNPLLEGNDDRSACTDRLARARAHVDRSLEEGISGCTTAADCTTLVPSTSCFAACPQPVAAAGLDATSQAVADAEERWCEGFAADCPAERLEPGPCPEGELRCVAEQCRLAVP